MLRASLLLLAWTAFTSSARQPALPGNVQDSVEWRGQAVCVDETGGRRECGPEGTNRYALQTADGKLHWFAPGDPLAPVFDDPRVRQQELVVKVRPRSDGTADLIKVYSAKHGKLHDVRYFCEICNVTSFVPGLCPCCRAEMELKETPVE
jgi:hypothetical protein